MGGIINKLRKQFSKECEVNPAYFTERYLEWLEGKLTSTNKAITNKPQISAFVEMVAGLSKTEYAAHEQLVSIINQAQKLLQKKTKGEQKNEC